MSVLIGTVQSHTVIRVPGRAQAGRAPFVLILVALDDGRRLLGHFHRSEPPEIGTRVKARSSETATPVFQVLGENHEAQSDHAG